ncbi:MAG: hypothetical protein AAF430_20600 [Myxococcota bacterium]
MTPVRATPLCLGLGLACLFACAGAPKLPPCGLDPARFPGRVGEVRVTRVDSLAGERGERARARVEQAARDWLEHWERWDPASEVTVAVELRDLRLRGSLTTWLFSAVAPPDRLRAGVETSEGGNRERWPELTVESGLSGFSWRDPEARSERLARRLGRRVAELSLAGAGTGSPPPQTGSLPRTSGAGETAAGGCL